MSADVHEKFVFKEEQGLFRYCEGNLSFSAASNDDDYNYSKKKISRDPMSHRIIEKRRRDRMNNCLADLSRLIPPEYLKKGRGRIEKTEIIEMAIKHMRHLQNIIASTTRFNENSDNSVPSPPATSAAPRDSSATAGDQPTVIEHYRLGYLECLSEAMRFLVEVQGYFAGDSLCLQMINHLHKHCDKMLKGNNLNFPKKQVGEAPSRDSSTSPTNVTFNNSPPLGMSNSTGSVASDDNPPGQGFDSARQPDNPSRGLYQGHRSPRRYSDASYTSKRNSDASSKRNSDACYPLYVESEGIDAENRSDSELHFNYELKCRDNEIRKDDPKSYLNNFESGVNNMGSRNYPVSNGVFSNAEDPGSFENASPKEENFNGTSQLREMLTSPSSVCAQLNGHSSRCATETKGSTSPMSNSSGCESSPGARASAPKGFKSDASEGNPDFSETSPADNHHMMYKFKNNIKQRFSKEKRENPECEADASFKKQKPNEDYLKYPDPLMKERLNLLDRTEADEDKVFKFSAELEIKKRSRYGSESDVQDGDISNRLSFGHKSIEKAKRWEETIPVFHCQSASKLWSLSPNASATFFGPPAAPRAAARPTPEYSSAMSNSFNNLSISATDYPTGIPIFALHAKGSFYIPLTLDHATLAPFLAILGVTKTDEGAEEKTVLHPVTISVNFQSHLVR